MAELLRPQSGRVNCLIQPNPGYTQCVSRFKRAKTAYPLGRRYIEPIYMKRDENENVLEELKNSAFEVWSKPIYDSTTTYNQYFSETKPPITQTIKRPSSATRKNNPHPPLVFLECRLHHVPGYHNPDATVGKEAYQCDNSTSQAEQERRHALRSKFQPRKDKRAVNQFSVRNETDEKILENIKDPFVKQAARGWLREASPRMKEEIERKIVNLEESREQRDEDRENGGEKFIASKYRFNKLAGPEEIAKNERQRGIINRPLASELTIGKRRQTDFTNMAACQPSIQRKQITRRGDFLIHPQWPPTFQHHRLNGLSTVDIPYSHLTTKPF